MPRVMSFWGVVSFSHLTKYVSVGVAREGALAKQDVHESAHSQVDLNSERFVVWFKHRPFGATVETFFDVENQSSNRDILAFVARVVPILITRAGAG